MGSIHSNDCAPFSGSLQGKQMDENDYSTFKRLTEHEKGEQDTVVTVAEEFEKKGKPLTDSRETAQMLVDLAVVGSGV